MTYDSTINTEILDRNHDILAHLVEQCKTNDRIPESAYSKSYIKRGLREADGTGVIAGVTRKGNVHGYIISDGERQPAKGELFY